MKRILAGALALSLMAGSAAIAAPNDRHDNNDRNDRGHNNHVQPAHHWKHGERLPSNYRTRDHYVDYRAHHLRQPPRGYQWVRADDNYALVALTSGLISEIIAANR
jgi:Ni/Co efflux regulator RcnB